MAMLSVSHERDESSTVWLGFLSHGDPDGVCHSSRISSVFFRSSSNLSSCSCVAMSSNRGVSGLGPRISSMMNQAS